MAGGRILITGATGFVGQKLVERLGAHDLTLAIRTVPPSTWGWERNPRVRNVVTGDIETSGALDTLFEGVDRVVHLAGHAHVIASERAAANSPTMRANADATARLVDAANRRGVRTFVHMSSVAAIAPNATSIVIDDATAPDPRTLYGRSKLVAEAHVARLANGGVLAVSLRPPLIVGAKGRGNLALLTKAAKSPLPLPLAGLHNRRSLISLEALCEALALLVEGDFPSDRSGAFAIADPQPLSLGDIVTSIRAGMGRPPDLFALPGSLFQIAGALSGRQAQIRALTGDLVVDGTRFANEFGFAAAVSARQSLRTIGDNIVSTKTMSPGAQPS